MKVLVAGAGIAGSVLTRMLRERGHEVWLVDPDPERAASRCAFAYLRTAWWTGEEKHRVREALRWYDSYGWMLHHQAVVTDLRRGRTFTQADHYVIDPSGPLLQPDKLWEVTGYFPAPAEVWVQLNQTAEMTADALVLACGAGMDRWSTGTPTYGAVFETSAPVTSWHGLHLLRVTDRMTHVAVAGSRITRVGASKGRTPASARLRAEAALHRMVERGVVDAADWKLREGVRWENLTGRPGGRRLDKGVWAFTGFARSGYATVPGAARDLVQELEQ